MACCCCCRTRRWPKALTAEHVAAITKFQAHVRRRLTQRWLNRFYRHSNRMKPHWWRLVFASLLFFKVLLVAVCVVTATDRLTQYDAAIPTARNTDNITPFQQHPHLFGWVYQTLVTSHVATGLMLFVFGVIPLFAAKGRKYHVIAGRLFLFAWLWHLVDGLINASVVLLARGYNEDQYPPVGFTMWLYVQFAFVANCVIDMLMTGLGNLQYKMSIPLGARVVLIVCNAVTIAHAVCLVGVACHVLTTPDITSDARDYAIVFAFEVPVYAVLMFLNIKHLVYPGLRSRFHQWLLEHQRNMVFTLNLTIITGMANVTNRYAPHLTVVLWALQDVVALYWAYTSSKALRRRLLGAKQKPLRVRKGDRKRSKQRRQKGTGPTSAPVQAV